MIPRINKPVIEERTLHLRRPCWSASAFHLVRDLDNKYDYIIATNKPSDYTENYLMSAIVLSSERTYMGNGNYANSLYATNTDRTSAHSAIVRSTFENPPNKPKVEDTPMNLNAGQTHALVLQRSGGPNSSIRGEVV